MEWWMLGVLAVILISLLSSRRGEKEEKVDWSQLGREIDQALTRRKQKKAAKKALKLNLMGHKVKVCPDCRGLGDSKDGVCKTCGGAGMVQS